MPSLSQMSEEELNRNWHVDQWLDSDSTHVLVSMNEMYAYVHFVLSYFRLPGVLKIGYEKWMKQHQLFVTYEGMRYRVTGASRLGDIWLAADFRVDHGYNLRVPLNFSKLTDWSDRPEPSTTPRITGSITTTSPQPYTKN